jgi:hypothetical protein
MELHSAVASPTIAVPVSTQFPWFAIRTRAKHEKVAANILANKGFEHMCRYTASGAAGPTG